MLPDGEKGERGSEVVRVGQWKRKSEKLRTIKVGRK